MMDWTDRHCRFLHRQLTRRALLYTEMVVAEAVIHGARERLLGFDPAEHPVALQLGGSDPAKLAEAARIGEAFGYDEINLNVGCPSDRVQSGTFGACLMRTPELVGECVAAMKAAVAIPVTVKCRIGVDEQDPEVALDALADAVFAAGADALWVHARKAWLEGLSPKENRDIPPLDYDRVYRLKARHPGPIHRHQRRHPDAGRGRAASRACRRRHARPRRLSHARPARRGRRRDLRRRAARGRLGGADRDHGRLRGRHVATGGRLSQVTRHMVGLFHGLPGARRYRQILSTEATRAGAGPEVLRAAFAAVDLSGGAKEAA